MRSDRSQFEKEAELDPGILSIFLFMDSPGTPNSIKSTSPPRAAPANMSFENENKQISWIRFLISNAAAGSVIGKGGATISEFQTQSGARIQLSRNYEYFPGTTDRVIALSGTTNEILTACDLILNKIYNEAEDDLDPRTNQVRLVVPNNVCGAIIGKGGATIRTFVEDSHASIKLSSQDQTIPGLRDRLVTITGTLEQQLCAIALIIKKISEDASYAQYAVSPLSYTGKNLLGMHRFQGPFSATAAIAPVSYGISPCGPYGINNSYHAKGVMSPLVSMRAAPFQYSMPVLPGSPSSTFVTIAVPDEYVGIIVGRGGKTISDIQQISGVRIKVSDRGDFVEGTTDRKVTITGSADCVYIAQQLLTQKIQQSSISDFDS